jgi:iron(III) transport system substrate-binding protein
MGIVRLAAIGLCCGLCCTLLAPVSLRAADLPPSTKKILDKFHLEPSVLDGLDKELTLPQTWTEGVKKEPSVQILGTWNPPEWKIISGPFQERYPSIKIEYVRSSRDNRQVQSLLAFKQGRYIADIISSFSSVYQDLKDNDGLADLRDMPTFGNALPGAYDSNGLWVAERLTYWCMAYNTDMVKPENLPKDWEDLLTNPYWRNGHFAVSNTVSGWLTSLAEVKGLDWTKNYMTRLFVEVKPQRRNEGRDASVQLAAAGEMAAVAPSGDYRVDDFASHGAPVSFHCPSIIPSAPAQLGILKGGPAPNGAKIFLNWFISKEGQLASRAATGAVSAHKDFQRRDFLHYPDEILDPSKKIVVDDFNLNTLDELQKLWTLAWNNELPGQK